MLVLGIETATRTGGVALVGKDGVVAEYTSNIEVTHSERLMAMVDRLLRDTGISLSSIEGVAVSTGPGSFTGLRIGIATVKGIALASDKPVAAVPTFAALAWNLPHAAHLICPLLDAKKKEVYAAIYRAGDGAPEVLLPETVLPLSELAGRIKEPVIFTGAGARDFRQELLGLLGSRALFAPLSATVPSAASVAELGRKALQAGERANVEALAPLYIRRPEAEVVWEKRQQSR